MSSTGSLAVLYRPRRFADVVGQRHVKVPLMRAAVSGSLPQQILLSGGSGLGKTTLARICAAALLCEAPPASRPDGDCCGSCRSCLDVAAGTHPDVSEVDAASNGRVDEIRELASRAQLSPMRGGYRVYIIDEVHGLSAAGGQAFLKLLEEPPSHVVFMLATTDPDKMLYTNRSRCTQFELTPPTDQELIENLESVMRREGIPEREDVAKEVLGASDHELGVRGTLMSLEKILPVLRADPSVPVDSVSEILGRPSQEKVSRILAAVSAKDPAAVITEYWELRARFPRTQLLARMSAMLAESITNSALGKAPIEDLSVLVSFAESLAAARRDDSDLATVSMLVKLTSVGPVRQSNHQSTASPTRRQPPLERPAPDMTPPTGGVPSPEQGEPTVPEPSPEVPGPSLAASSLGTGDMGNNDNTIDGFIYATDPFTSPLPVAQSGVPAAAEEPAPHESSSAAAVLLQRLLDRLAEPSTPRSRLLVAKLRPARASLESGVLVLQLPPQAVAGLEPTAEFKDAASSLGVQVSFSSAM